MKHNLGDMWKEGNDWLVQFPKGIMAFKTKKIALLWQDQIRKDYNI